jgi:mono/diheme cytochrome c family protein
MNADEGGSDLYLVSACERGYDGLVMGVYFALLATGLFCLTVFASAFNTPPRPAAQIYRRHCISCHGSDGKAKTSKGRFSHARDFTDAQWQADVSDERIFNSITNGRNVRGNMPAFTDKLSAKEVNSLVTFVRGFKGQQ